MIIIIIIIINSRIFGTTAIKNGVPQRTANSGVRTKLKKIGSTIWKGAANDLRFILKHGDVVKKEDSSTFLFVVICSAF